MQWNLGHFLWILFQWPQGIVVGNLLANIIWEWPSQMIHYWRTHHQNKKQTKQLKAHINEVVSE
jgi:hypothetical protein